MAGKTLEVVFRNAADSRTIAATGVWGGVGPTGDIVAQFFVDRGANPESVTLDVSQFPHPEVKRVAQDQVIREIQTAVVMRPDVAHSIGVWLMQKAKEAGYQPGKLPQ